MSLSALGEAIDWNSGITLMLQAMQAGQQALLHGMATLGLVGDIAGQPAWPFSTRLSGEVLLIDRSVARTLLTALGASAMALLLAGAAIAWRRVRPALLLIAALLVWWAPWPEPALLRAAATPTSFHVSPTAFSAASIVQGEHLYVQRCAACHGANGKGDTPLGLSLQTAPPNLAGVLLWRRADGDLLWHILHGKGVMPAFDQTLSVADAWTLLDYMKANAAGTSLRETGLWQQPVALPALNVQCGTATAQTSQWRGQRVRLVLPDKDQQDPMEDPRLRSVLIGPPDPAAAVGGRPRIDCSAAGRQTVEALAIITGTRPQTMAGMQLIADRDGWLRARKNAADATGWSDADMLCRSPVANGEKSGGGVQQPGLDGLIAAMDAEPVKYVKGGFVH